MPDPPSPGADGAADAAALARTRAICLGFPGADETEFPSGRPLFRVGRRRFAIFTADSLPAYRRWDGCGRSLHFLADPAELDALRQDGRFRPSPHHGNKGWLALVLDDAVDWDEVAELLESAYRQAAPRRLWQE